MEVQDTMEVQDNGSSCCSLPRLAARLAIQCDGPDFLPSQRLNSTPCERRTSARHQSMVANPRILRGCKQKIASCESRFFYGFDCTRETWSTTEPKWHTSGRGGFTSALAGLNRSIKRAIGGPPAPAPNDRSHLHNQQQLSQSTIHSTHRES